MELVTEAKKRFLGSVLDDVLGYWRVYDRLKVAVLANTGDKRADFRSEDQFWASVLGDRFAGPKQTKYVPVHSGQVVRFRDVFASEWVPKLPGRTWTVDGLKDMREGMRHVAERIEGKDQTYILLDPHGKEKVVAAGYGTVRLNPSAANSDWFTCLTLSTAANWECDRGIPVVVSRPVYDEFQRHARRGAPWVESVEGILHVGEDLPVRAIVPTAIGANLPDGLDSILRYRPFLPKCFVYVSSPLSIKFRHNDSHPLCTAWTVFEAKGRQPLRFTYTKFDPSKANTAQEAVEFIKWYVQRYDGKRILVDFDGQEPKLEAAVAIKTDPVRSKKSTAALKGILEDVGKWAKEAERHPYQ